MRYFAQPLFAGLLPLLLGMGGVIGSASLRAAVVRTVLPLIGGVGGSFDLLEFHGLDGICIFGACVFSLGWFEWQGP